jgi:hypothetical protein
MEDERFSPGIFVEHQRASSASEIWGVVEKAASQFRNGNMPDAIQTDRSGRCRGQINIPTPDKGAAIVNANCNASTVTNANPRSEGQSAMSRRHCCAIYSLTIGRGTSTMTVAPAIDARHLCVRSAY